MKQDCIEITGMTCINCQNRIKAGIAALDGVRRVSVDYKTGKAEIEYDENICSTDQIRTCVTSLGYQVVTRETRKKTLAWKTAIVLLITFILYVLLERFGILNLLVPSKLADQHMGYGMLFVIGLLTSVHCIAMCGGMNLSQCIPTGKKESGKKGSDSPWTMLKPAIFYNLGRVFSYTAIGFFLGLVGRVIGGGENAGLSTWIQGLIKIVAGVFMIIMGINLLGIFPWLRRFTLRMPGFLTRKIHKKKMENRKPLIVGILNGFMPCGPLQTMQIVALASGNPFAGACSMLMFSLGTVPLMLGLGSFVSMLGKRFSQKVMEVGALFVVVLGIAMMSQGVSLSGFSDGMPWNLGKLQKSDGNAVMEAVSEPQTLEDGVQVINSTLSGGRYPDISVQAGIPVKWIIDVPKGSLNGCNYRMVVPAYGLTHTFSEGENIIEFTPEEMGTISYTCWMGMIRGKILVTNDAGEMDDFSSGSNDTDSAENAWLGNSRMGCCGGF